MFTWLTLICANLSRTVAISRPKHSRTRTFMVFCLFGWGFPLAMSVATFAATQLDDNSYFKVYWDKDWCWFQPVEGKALGVSLKLLFLKMNFNLIMFTINF